MKACSRNCSVVDLFAFIELYPASLNEAKQHGALSLKYINIHIVSGLTLLDFRNIVRIDFGECQIGDLVVVFFCGAHVGLSICNGGSVPKII